MSDHHHDHPLDEGLDDIVRQADRDRWLAARFIADEAARSDVIALYALNHELARATEVARDALMGEIRLTWWREAMEEIAAGKPHRRHPVVDVLAHAPIDPQALADLAEARMADLEDGAFAGEGEAVAYIDATAGALMHLAALRLSPGAEPVHTRAAARAWGLAGLHRLGGRLPVDWTAKGVSARVEANLAAANREGRGLPTEAFPAVAYTALSRRYAAGGDWSDLGRRARLTWAVATGRV